jgi:hypothetical protein
MKVKGLVVVWVVSIFTLSSFIPSVSAHDLPTTDFSDYITPYDDEVIKVAETIGVRPFLSYTLDNVRNAYYWVSENIRYMYDEERWGTEYYQLPRTTIKLGTGDCEDQALLLASLLRALKLPRDNIRLVVGPVSGNVYHAWVEIKLPLPIYGLEAEASKAISLLENKKISVSIGESSYEVTVSGTTVAEIKTKGLSHRDGWIPLDTTAKISGLPLPFTWWLTYGYNVYALFGCRATPQLTFQDKPRIWESDREVERNGNIVFDIPCTASDRILGAVKVKQSWREQVLNVQPQGGFYNIRFGPVTIQAGETLRFEWSADRSVKAYILNEADMRNLIIIYGQTPPSSRAEVIAQTGFIQYTAIYPDKFYIYIIPASPLQSFVIYSWIAKRLWQETSCNVQLSVIDPSGAPILVVPISQREVEKRFDFTAEKNGIYKVTVRNAGAESATIFVRLEEFTAPLSPAIAGIGERIAAAEQKYVEKIAESIKEGSSDGSRFVKQPLPTIISPTILFATLAIAVAAITIIVAAKKRAGK